MGLFSKKKTTTTGGPEGSKGEVQALATRLQEGFHGQIPSSFGIFFAGLTVDKKANLYYIGSPASASFAIFKGMVKHQITIYSGDFNSQPLAFGGTERLFKSTSIIALPNEILEIKDGGNYKRESYQFGEFEWQCIDFARKPRLRELLKNQQVIGTWEDELNPEQQSKMGQFSLFQPLSEQETLKVVAVMIRVCQISWEATAAADSMIKASGRILSAGVSLAF